MSDGCCTVDRWLRGLTVSTRKVLIASAGSASEGWHPLLRELVQCAAADLLLIREEEAAVFERIVDHNAELELLDESVLDDPDGAA